MAGRGEADVKEKLALVKEATKEVGESKTVQSIAAAVSTAVTTAVSAAAAAAGAAQTGKVQQKVKENVVDLQDDLEQLVEDVMPEDSTQRQEDPPRTRAKTLPVEHVEL